MVLYMFDFKSSQPQSPSGGNLMVCWCVLYMCVFTHWPAGGSTPLATAPILSLQGPLTRLPLLPDNRSWPREKSGPWSSRGRRWRKRCRGWWRRSRRWPWSFHNIFRNAHCWARGKDTEPIMSPSLSHQTKPGLSDHPPPPPGFHQQPLQCPAPTPFASRWNPWCPLFP